MHVMQQLLFRWRSFPRTRSHLRASLRVRELAVLGYYSLLIIQYPVKSTLVRIHAKRWEYATLILHLIPLSLPPPGDTGASSTPRLE